MIRADIAIGVWWRTSTELAAAPPSKVSIGGGIVPDGRHIFLSNCWTY